MIYWNVAKDGKHLFRTDQYDSFDQRRIEIIRQTLIVKFPRNEGYEIHEHSRSATWESKVLQTGCTNQLAIKTNR